MKAESQPAICGEPSEIRHNYEMICRRQLGGINTHRGHATAVLRYMLDCQNKDACLHAPNGYQQSVAYEDTRLVNSANHNHLLNL